MTEQSVFAGAALRRLRKREGMTQASMAQRIGISPSYLTLMERNQRAVSARVIVQLVEQFDFDPRHLREEESIGGLDGLHRRLADERFADLGMDREEAAEFLANAPQAAAAFARLFDEGGGKLEDRYDPLVACRKEIDRWKNHFPDLDEAAEKIADELRLTRADFLASITDRLREKHQMAIRILPREIMPEALRRLDLHARQIQLSEMLAPESRHFQLAMQLAELEMRDLIRDMAAGSSFEDDVARVLYERYLAGYFAAGLMMPYGRFLRACDATGYDMNVLTRRFGASIEQVAHRLTTLQRVGQRGLPFFLARVDRAGQFSKLISGASGTSLIDAEHGCPLWHVHHAFERLGRWQVQAVALEEGAPGGTHWFTMSHAVESEVGGTGGQFAIVLGLEAKLATDLAQAKGVSTKPEDAQPIGLGCGRCYRRECRQRSLPPRGAQLEFDRMTRDNTAFTFAKLD